MPSTPNGGARYVAEESWPKYELTLPQHHPSVQLSLSELEPRVA